MKNRKRHRAAPGKGEVYINFDSGLRKLMRAARRGKIPPERERIIKDAMEKAAKHG
jgi:hypothetical protein